MLRDRWKRCHGTNSLHPCLHMELDIWPFPKYNLINCLLSRHLRCLPPNDHPSPLHPCRSLKLYAFYLLLISLVLYQFSTHWLSDKQAPCSSKEQLCCSCWFSSSSPFAPRTSTRQVACHPCLLSSPNTVSRSLEWISKPQTSKSSQHIVNSPKNSTRTRTRELPTFQWSTPSHTQPN